MSNYPAFFIEAMPHVFEHEGGYNDVKNDLGGATNWGVSLRFLKAINKDVDGDGDVDYLDVKNLSKENATEIYFNHFWKRYYEKLPRRIAIKMFDTEINTDKAELFLQRALVLLGSKITVDKMIGLVTLLEVKKYTDQAVLDAYTASQKAYYDAIIKAKPDQEKFRKGWYNRAEWQPK